jgi:UDP-N-acetylmuramoyl-tripeptide--D-alanyl-D-alanine ligase
MNVAIKLDNQPFGFQMRLHEAADALGAHWAGEDVMLQGISTDTRTLQAGQLFVALHGPNFDGHDYLVEAKAKGAAACMVEKPVANCSALFVGDTRLALGQLARAWRRHFAMPLIAVTGSNGKTTVKEMLASIFVQLGDVLATRGNLNNDIGVPLTLLGLDSSHTSAVVELGANHGGEIAYLTALAEPNVAVITNAASAHLEGFGTLTGVANAKGEIFQGLKDDGTAIINADDEFASLWRGLAKDKKVLSFGLRNPADITAQWQAGDHGSQIHVSTPAGKVKLQLALLGQHNVMNALAAIAAAQAAGIKLATIKAGLESMQPVAGRLQLKAGSIHGSRIIDDTYNANPASLAAAIEVLAGFAGKHVLVLGDMGELGDEAKELHAEAGRFARAHGVDRLVTVGPMAAAAAEAFGKGAQQCDDHEDVSNVLEQELGADVTVLVKGSRLSQMERVVQRLESGGTN